MTLRATPFAWGSLGEMIAVLGPPDVVGIDADFTRSYYLAGSMMFFHDRIKPAYVNMDEPFDTLSVFDHVLSVPSDPYISAWQGFSSIRHYQVANPRLLENSWANWAVSFYRVLMPTSLFTKLHKWYRKLSPRCSLVADNLQIQPLSRRLKFIVGNA